MTEFLPLVLPANWRLVEKGEDGAAYMCTTAPIAVIVSASTEADGRRWLHVSLSRPSRIPSWEDTKNVKEIFIGDRYAYSVLPPRAKYVNINPHVLHLFAPLEGDPPLPDFTRGGNSL